MGKLEEEIKKAEVAKKEKLKNQKKTNARKLGNALNSATNKAVESSYEKMEKGAATITVTIDGKTVKMTDKQYKNYIKEKKSKKEQEKKGAK